MSAPRPERLPFARFWRSPSRRAAGGATASMSTVTLYTKPGCHLCEDVRAALERVRREMPFELIECDIRSEETLHQAYFDRIPVVTLDGQELCEHVLDEHALRAALTARRP